MFLGAQKNRLMETVLFSTRLRHKKINFQFSYMDAWLSGYSLSVFCITLLKNKKKNKQELLNEVQAVNLVNS